MDAPRPTRSGWVLFYSDRFGFVIEQNIKRGKDLFFLPSIQLVQLTTTLRINPVSSCLIWTTATPIVLAITTPVWVTDTRVVVDWREPKMIR